MIEEYYFGFIKILGKTYDYDVEVYWTGEILKWWREESHLIKVEDIKRAVDKAPDLIIIGIGESGFAEVLDKTKEKILSEGIGLIIEKTKKATEIFNENIKKGRKVVGLFHLTC